MFDTLFTIFVIVAVFTVLGAVMYVPKNRNELQRAMCRWALRLEELDEHYFEVMRDIRTARHFALAMTGKRVSEFGAWHSYMGYSLPRDWLAWQRFKHQRGRYLIESWLWRRCDRLTERWNTLPEIPCETDHQHHH